MNPTQFLRYVITPTLADLDMYSPAAAMLLLGTAVTESNLEYLRQLPDGPALSVYQIEPATARDVLYRYLPTRPSIMARVEETMTSQTMEVQLLTNLAFATAIARVKYWMVPQPLPDLLDADGMGRYWKTHYNTAGGAGDPAKFARIYRAQRLD